MQIDNRIHSMISEAAQKLGIRISVLDETGEYVASSDPSLLATHEEFLENVDFENGIARDTETGKTFFLLETENYRPLRIALDGVSAEVERYGYLITVMLDELLKTTLKKPGREEVFRRVMLDRIDPLDMQEAIRDYRINTDIDRCVIIIQTFDGDGSRIYESMLKLFPRQNGDVVVSMNRYVVAIIKQIEDDIDMDNIVQMVQAMDETISTDLAVDACIGVGTVKRGMSNVRESFKEAQEAINLGLIQQTQGRVFFFQRLLLERFLQEVPRDLRRQFYELAFSDPLKKVLNDEMLTTITKFFDNNLNLSEAARKLYIHRNTLIYRLDKIQKVTGLDLRRFEDSMLLKIIIMMGKSLSSNNRLE